MNRVFLYDHCDLPGKGAKAKAALCDLMGLPRRRADDIQSAAIRHDTSMATVAMTLSDGEEWAFSLGDERPRRTAGVLELWKAVDPGGRRGLAGRAAARANEAAGQLNPEVIRLAQQHSRPMTVQTFCDGCREGRAIEELKRCGGCRRVSYCSIECQRAHWNAHKPHCKAAGPAATATAGGAATATAGPAATATAGPAAAGAAGAGGRSGRGDG
jgi:hypothetical protein